MERIIEGACIAENLFKHGLKGPATPKVAGDLRRDAASGDEAVITLDDILSETLDVEERWLFSEVGTLATGDRSGAGGVGTEGLEHEEREVAIELGGPTYGDMGLKDSLSNAVRWLKARWAPLRERAQSATLIYKLMNAGAPEVRYRQLHAALKHLNRADPSFDPSSEETAYLAAARETAVKGDFDVVVYGHTHLPKRVQLSDDPPRPRWYFNTGTWCDVIRLPDSLASSYEECREELLRFIESLRANDYSQYTRRYLSYVEILVDLQADGRVPQADLYSYCGLGQERASPLKEFPGKNQGR